MSNRSGRHAAGTAPEPEQPTDGIDYSRPAGVQAPFAPHSPELPYAPPPPTVSPEERAVFGRPAGAAQFDPPATDRVVPGRVSVAAVPAALAENYQAPATARAGFDPPSGSRLDPRARRAESPWWKADAHRDPWRDPGSPYWLGQGAIFAGARPAQLDPDDDVESDLDIPVEPPPHDTQAPAVPARRGRFGLSALGLMLVAALLAGAIGGGIGYWLANRTDGLLHRPDVHLAQTDTPANRPPGSVADIAKRVGPAVVSVSVTTANSFSEGSGVVIDKAGYVLTNDHVIDVGPGVTASIIVTFSNEDTAKARVVGADPTSDLAVLKVPNSALTVASLGNSDGLAVGDPVIAIGSPLGLQGTVTQGIVSALNRPVHIDEASAAAGVYINAIQTDAAINHGNSGGALVDAAGAVVGINSAAAVETIDANGDQTTASGIGFAIPINYARIIATELIATGSAVHATIGVQGHSATTADGLDDGAYLVQITPGGPAAKAGMLVGDVIVAANGKPVQSYDQLVVLVQALNPGDKLSVTYFRGAAKKTATITLGKA